MDKRDFRILVADDDEIARDVIIVLAPHEADVLRERVGGNGKGPDINR